MSVVKPVLRGHLWDNIKWPLNRGSIHMTGQEKDDLLIQVTAWAGLTVFIFRNGDRKV